VKFLPLYNAASKLKPNGLLTVILTYAEHVAPNSPDLNPVDYAVWGALQKMVYHHKTFTSVQELKRAIVTAWQQLVVKFRVM